MFLGNTADSAYLLQRHVAHDVCLHVVERLLHNVTGVVRTFLEHKGRYGVQGGLQQLFHGFSAEQRGRRSGTVPEQGGREFLNRAVDFYSAPLHQQRKQWTQKGVFLHIEPHEKHAAGNFVFCRNARHELGLGKKNMRGLMSGNGFLARKQKRKAEVQLEFSSGEDFMPLLLILAFESHQSGVDPVHGRVCP